MAKPSALLFIYIYEFAETLWTSFIDNPDHSSAGCVVLVPKWMIEFASESVTTKLIVKILIAKKDWDEHKDMFDWWKIEYSYFRSYIVLFVYDMSG